MRSEDIVGKCFVKKEDFEQAKRNGFHDVEIGLRKEDLKDVKKTISFLESSGLRVVAVHTPHADTGEEDFFSRSAQIAMHFSVFMILHSNRISEADSCRISRKIPYENKGVESTFGNIKVIESCLIKKGCGFVLDVAHFYIASGDFFADLEYLFKKYPSRVKWVHLCDSTKSNDGLPFGQGEIDIERLVKFLDWHYNGKLTVEVMPEFQKAAKDRCLEILGR